METRGVGEVEQLKQEIERLHLLVQRNHTDAMVAHRFIEWLVGEQARGRDFSVKVPMAAALIQRMRQALTDIAVRGIYGEGDPCVTPSELREIARAALAQVSASPPPSVADYCETDDVADYLRRESASPKEEQPK